MGAADVAAAPGCRRQRAIGGHEAVPKGGAGQSLEAPAALTVRPWTSGPQARAAMGWRRERLAGRARLVPSTTWETAISLTHRRPRTAAGTRPRTGWCDPSPAAVVCGRMEGLLGRITFGLVASSPAARQRGRAVDPVRPCRACGSAPAESAGHITGAGQNESGGGDPSRVGHVSARFPTAGGPSAAQTAPPGRRDSRPRAGRCLARRVSQGRAGGTKSPAVFRHASAVYPFSFDSDAHPFLDRCGRLHPCNARPRSRRCAILAQTASLRPSPAG